MKEQQNDFAAGSVVRNILNLAVPMTLAQVINVLYNIVDRIYIGRIPGEAIATLSLTGIGLCLPIVSAIMAFAFLFGTGGAPLCSIERGRGNVKEAEMIMGNSFFMIVVCGILLTIVGLIFKKPLLFLLGASQETFFYADQYVSIYLFGSVFVMIGLGMNSFINSQGFGRIGMMTVLLGAVLNLILDPIFIFVFHMGVRGAAIATVISQAASAIWILQFLTGKKALLKLKRSSLRLNQQRVGKIVTLGLSGFTMAITNSMVQMFYNSTLQQYGGDIYVAVMTVVNSVREVITMPVSGLTQSAQPVIGFNYGAGKYQRVKKAVAFISIATIVYTTAMWSCVHLFPTSFIRMFNKDPKVLQIGISSMRIYFFGFFMMSLQFAGQAVFVALGKAKKAMFFSVFRKVIIVIPLIFLLPGIGGLGTEGIFMAEPISNFIGGIACYVTMFWTLRKELKD